MSRTRLLIGWSLALALAGTITACKNPPAGPTPPGGNSATPTATRLEITGPRAIVPGVPTQFTATVQMSDGSSRDVTTSASWRSASFPPGSPGSMQFVVSAPGLVTAQVNGVFDLSVASGGLTSTREVIAVPEGTFRLTGIVMNVTAPAGPVSGAEVQVTDGTGRGLPTFTSTDGRYALFGVAGDIELRVTKAGYRPLVQRVMVTDHQTLNLDLPIVAPLPDVSGSWVLTITAADTCSTALPAEALSRRYAASIKQVGPEIKIDLGGARFVNLYLWVQNVIAGRVAPDNVEFYLGELYCRGYQTAASMCGGDAVMEELTPSRVYLPSGGVRLAISPAVLSGELNGEIAIHTRSAPDTFSPEASCRSSRHRVTFSK